MKAKSEGLERSQCVEFGRKSTVGGEGKTGNKRDAVIAVSLETNRGTGINNRKETDKAPLTAASSCFLGLCHDMTPP